MKTETQIAEENIEKLKDWNSKETDDRIYNLGISQQVAIRERDMIIFALESQSKEHKASCQRFLKFLESFVSVGLEDSDSMYQKITDLKQAIKEYEENGI